MLECVLVILFYSTSLWNSSVWMCTFEWKFQFRFFFFFLLWVTQNGGKKMKIHRMFQICIISVCMYIHIQHVPIPILYTIHLFYRKRMKEEISYPESKMAQLRYYRNTFIKFVRTFVNLFNQKNAYFSVIMIPFNGIIQKLE